MKHVPNGREERETARGWDPRTHEERTWQTAGGQGDEELLRVVKSVTATQCDQAAAGADVPKDAPQAVGCRSARPRT